MIGLLRDDTSGMRNLGLMRREDGKINEARELFEKALNAEEDNAEERTVETVSGNDTDEPVSRPRFHQLKRYKIQEVIHRGQVAFAFGIIEADGIYGA